MQWTSMAKRMRSGKERQTGFAYLLLLVALAIVGVSAATALRLGAQMTRRGAEDELLAIGAEYERALASYRMATPAGQVNRAPSSLADLLKDPRYPTLKRHLRRVYPDPLTGADSWGFVRGANGVILGVYSEAQGRPIKRTGFDASKLHFEDAKSYRDWVFGLQAPQIVPPR